jgi:hypothetical protein
LDRDVDVAVDISVNDMFEVLNSQHAALVAWRAGMSSAMARLVVAIAERVAELPALIEAFRRGELSLDQMATIARNAPAWADVQSRDYAIVLTVTQLRHVLRKYPFPALEADGREAPDADPVDAPAPTPTT